MMPASKEQLVETILKRTTENLKIFEDIAKNDVTLYINSMIGLLVIPEQELYEEITDEMFNDKELLNNVKDCVDKKYSTDLKEIVRHLRNSVCHGHISFDGEKPPLNFSPAEIKKIIFEDYKNEIQTYKMIISVELFKSFVVEFSEAALNLTARKTSNYGNTGVLHGR